MTIDQHGYIIFCCHSTKTRHAHLSQIDNLLDFFNNDLYTTSRKMLWTENKVHHACEYCIERNNRSIPTIRTHRLQNDVDVDIENYNKQVIKSLEISFSNLCNQQCVMCNSSFSSQWASDDKRLENTKFARKFEKYDYALTSKDLDKVLSCIDYIEEINIKGGEPTIDPNFQKFIEYLAKHKPNQKLRIVSNFQKIDNKLLNNLAKLTNLKLVVSVDGTNEVYNWIRGGDYNTLVKNLQNYSAKAVSKGIGFTTAFTAYNLYHLKDFVIDLESLNSKLSNNEHNWLALRYVEHPKYVSPLILPKEERKNFIEEFLRIINYKNTTPSFKSLKFYNFEDFKKLCDIKQVENKKNLSLAWKNEIDAIRGFSI